MLKPLTETQKVRIINNIVKATKDITLLSKQAYDYINLASGFIAHHNHAGFIEHYKHHSLTKNILHFHKQNLYTNFRPNDENYDYYMAKADVYNRICEKLK